MEVQKNRVIEILNGSLKSYHFKSYVKDFQKIPGTPIAYWVPERVAELFRGKRIKDFGYAGIGMRTGDNLKFLRFWTEVENNNIHFGCLNRTEQVEAKLRWIPYNKGGNFRKWYGNNEYIVEWFNDGEQIKENTKKTYPQLGDNLGWKISNEDYYYKPGITWSGVTSGIFSCRVYDVGFIFDSGANGLFAFKEENKFFLAAILNSKVGDYILKVLNPTINTGSGTLNNVPVVMTKEFDTILRATKQNISISITDWDSFETSWDFEKHPLLKYMKIENENRADLISSSFSMWSQFAENQFYQLKANEEELNRIFIEIYGLQDELTPQVDEKDVTVRKADLGRDIRSFVSYAIGCMFGRYSLDVDGLAYAGGEWDASKCKTFIPDADNIIPLSEDSYFEDDLLHRFIEFVRVVYGSEKLEENLEFIANALGTRGQSARESIRNYLLNDFYKDHLKIYQKRPIYWMFESGKNNGFKALIYMHRYDRDTLAKMRMDYVHRMQEYYRTEIQHLNEMSLRSDEQRERIRITKEVEKLKLKEDELFVYEQKLHHMADQRIAIDLDDGVVVNYAKFEGLVGKIG